MEILKLFIKPERTTVAYRTVMLQSPGVQAAAYIVGDLDWGFVINGKQADALDTCCFVNR